MANELRGESTITLNGEKMALKLTYDKMMAIESELSTPLPALFNKLMAGQFRLSELEAVLKHAMACSGRKFQPAIFRQHVEKEGSLKLASEVISLVAVAIGGPKASAEPEAEDAEGNAAPPAE